MTRISNEPLHKAYNELERELPKRRKEARRKIECEGDYFEDLFNTNKMANIDDMSMDDYNNGNTEAKGFGVERPEIKKEKPFEIKGQFLNMIYKLEFTGMEDDDPSFHLREVEEISNFFNIPEVDEDQVMLRLFPATLKGNAKKCLFGVPSGEIDTWPKLNKN